jgi:DNA-binding LacI/PurR family transcriptional regulator
VAAAAQTSKPIASRILNGDATLNVGVELRERVLAAARDLGYRPHAAARSLRRAASGAVGLLVPALGSPVYTQLMRGAFRRAVERGFTVVLAEDFEEQEAGEIFARLVLEGRIDGLLVASTRPDHPLLAELEKCPLPHVFVNRGLPGSGRNVLMDDARAVELVLDHLVSAGHTRIVHLCGPSDLDPTRRRVAVFRALAAQYRLQRAEVVAGDFSERGGAEAAREALQRWPDVTALFADTVSQAIGVLSLAWERGLRVPDELSIVAQADTPLAEFMTPPLTAVRMPLAELGAASVDALIEQIQAGIVHDVFIETKPQLVARGSIAPPRVGRLEAARDGEDENADDVRLARDAQAAQAPIGDEEVSGGSDEEYCQPSRVPGGSKRQRS